ncbi:hypothetical protein [Marinobacter sp. W-8]|uniref:hypothetical protein n=1 Tax=Marinobacter sp. W-8 TaxID=3369658 RepID=UPI0037C51CE9
MNFRASFLALVAVLPLSVSSAEYLDGWDSEPFYEAVNFCRSSIVYPGTQDYIGKAEESGTPSEQAREDALKTMPVLDSLATPICFCVVSEIAKDHAPSDYPESVDLEAYMQVPRCANAMKERMEWIQSNPEEVRSLRLR